MARRSARRRSRRSSVHHSSFIIHHSLRRSFTITELLIVMMVIALMASMTLFALHGVMEEAKLARTQAQVAKLNELIMTRWEALTTRPVPIKITPSAADPRLAPAYRLAALREIMRMELPDRITDVTNNPVTPGLTRTSLSQNYLRRVSSTTWTTNTGHQGAECLYLIVASIRDGDSNGLDFFKSSEIGDLDNDGAKEILDAWGNPITFLRWPAGHDSPIQTRNAAQTPDPFDPLRVDQYFWKRFVNSSSQHRLEDNDTTNDTFALFPLIVSAGADKIYDINVNTAYDYAAAAYAPPATYGANDPYAYLGTVNAIGTRMDANGDGVLSFYDNISNHFTGNY